MQHHRANNILKHQPHSTTTFKQQQHQRQLCASCDHSFVSSSSHSHSSSSASSSPCSSFTSSLSPSPCSSSACELLKSQTTQPAPELNCACNLNCNCFNLIMTKCQGDSLKLTCSVYPSSNCSSSSWLVHERHESTLTREEERMERKRIRKTKNASNFTLIWSTLPLLLLPLLLLPMVNAYSASSLSTLAVNPSSSTAFKSSPGVPSTILASGGTSSSSSLSSSLSSSSSSTAAGGGRNAFATHRTNQYQETQHATSSLTGTNFAHGYNSFQSHSQSTNSITPSQFDWLTREAIGEVKKVFYSRIQKYNGCFIDLLKSSKREFHTMFLQTYGLLYERNSEIFTDMFKQLEIYYLNGTIELNEVFDSFFHLLYSKMFQVLNAQYTFDQTYLNCVTEKMEELKPFGDIPKKIKTEVKRSFIATRTFVQSMLGASEVLEKLEHLMTLSPSSECSRALDVFTSCPDCLNATYDAAARSGFNLNLHSNGENGNYHQQNSHQQHQQQQHGQGIKFCSSVCTSAMYKCLNFNNDLNDEWNKFVTALISLLTRLETSFNIEAVVEPIDIKISEAIMNFQDNGVAISTKLFEQCGRPKIGKRDLRGQEQQFKLSHHQFKRQQEHLHHRLTDLHRQRRWTQGQGTGGHHGSRHHLPKANSQNKPHPVTESDDAEDDDDADDESSDENAKTGPSSTHSEFGGPHSSPSSSSHGQLLPLASASSSASTSSSPGAAIDVLLAEVKKKVKKTRDYWKRLPSIICSHRFINQVTRSTDCWNGTAVIQNDVKNIATFSSLASSSSSSSSLSSTSSSAKIPGSNSNGNRNQKRASSSSSLSPDASGLLKGQITRLKSITNNLLYAYNGLDAPRATVTVDEESGDEPLLATAIEGSGDERGSGDGECEDGDEDCEDSNRDDKDAKVDVNVTPVGPTPDQTNSNDVSEKKKGGGEDEEKKPNSTDSPKSKETTGFASTVKPNYISSLITILMISLVNCAFAL